MYSTSLRGTLLAFSIFIGAIAAAPTAKLIAQQKAAPPDFSSNNAGWVGLNGNGPFFEAVPGREPGPVTQDPKYPFVPNGVGGQPTFRIADLSNPNLKPWVKQHIKKGNDEVLAGKIGFTAGSSCMPLGVPGFMSQRRTEFALLRPNAEGSADDHSEQSASAARCHGRTPLGEPQADMVWRIGRPL